MTAEEEEVALVVKRDDLPALELRQRREERAEQFSDRETEPRLEVVEDELGRVGRLPGVARDLARELDRCQLEVGRRAIGQVDDRDGVWRKLAGKGQPRQVYAQRPEERHRRGRTGHLAVLVDDNERIKVTGTRPPRDAAHLEAAEGRGAGWHVSACASDEQGRIARAGETTHLPPGRLKNWPPGKMPRSSSANAYVSLQTLALVVMRILGSLAGPPGSEREAGMASMPPSSGAVRFSSSASSSSSEPWPAAEVDAVGSEVRCDEPYWRELSCVRGTLASSRR